MWVSFLHIGFLCGIEEIDDEMSSSLQATDNNAMDKVCQVKSTQSKQSLLLMS